MRTKPAELFIPPCLPGYSYTRTVREEQRIYLVQQWVTTKTSDLPTGSISKSVDHPLENPNSILMFLKEINSPEPAAQPPSLLLSFKNSERRLTYIYPRCSNTVLEILQETNGRRPDQSRIQEETFIPKHLETPPLQESQFGCSPCLVKGKNKKRTKACNIM